MALPSQNVLLSDILPREHVGDEIKPIWPHPFVRWVERLCGRPTAPVMYVRGKKIERDLAFMIGGQLIMPRSMHRELRSNATFNDQFIRYREGA